MLNEKQLNEQPSAIAALTSAVGPSLAYHISECAHGGYIVIVDGAVHCACTYLHEAIDAMGRVAASRYGQSATSPGQAAIVQRDTSRVEDDPDLDHAADVAGPYGPRRPARRMPDGNIERAMEYARRTAQSLVLAVLIGGSVVMWRGVA